MHKQAAVDPLVTAEATDKVRGQHVGPFNVLKKKIPKIELSTDIKYDAHSPQEGVFFSLKHFQLKIPH